MKCTIKETKPSGEIKEDTFTFEDKTETPECEEKSVAPGPIVPVIKLASILALMLGGAGCRIKR